jgi:hypothetical protein
MPKDKFLDKQLQENAMNELQRYFKLKTPEEQLGISLPMDSMAVSGEYKTQKLPPAGGSQNLMQDPSIDYGTVQSGRDMLKRMDSPEYQQAQQELQGLSRSVMGLPENSRTPDMMQQLEMKRKALEMLRKGMK